MRFNFKPSFDRSLKAFQDKEKEGLKKVAMDALDILSGGQLTYKGIGLRHLKNNYWEIRKGLKARILFRWQGDFVEFILAGDHNDIKHYLKNI